MGRRPHSPHAQHIDQVLFGYIILLVDVTLEGGKDLPPTEETFAGNAFQLAEFLVPVALGIGPRLTALDGNHKVLELFPEDNNALLVKEGVGLRIVVVRGSRLGR